MTIRPEVVYLDKPVPCTKCKRVLTSMAVVISNKLYGYFCALRMGWPG